MSRTQVSYWTGDVTDFADWWTRPPSEGGAEGLVPSGEPFDVASLWRPHYDDEFFSSLKHSRLVSNKAG